MNSSHVEFTESGDLLRWKVEGEDMVEWPPSRANAPVDFGGIQIWVNTAHGEYDGLLLPKREDEVSAQGENGSWTRKGLDWELSIDWSFEEHSQSVTLDVVLHAFSEERQYQIEYLVWVPQREGAWPEVCGVKEGKEHRSDLEKYGAVQTCFFDSESDVEAVWKSGRFLKITSDPKGGQPHFYHRGRLLKLGATSAAFMGGGAPQKTRFMTTVGMPSFSDRGTRPVHIAPQRRHEWPKIALPPPCDYASGLMLHLQYIGGSRELLDAWVALSYKLGYRFILLELNRALQCHPEVPSWAWTWQELESFVKSAATRGIEIVPGYNLLGHQGETGLLKWRPDWRETHFDCLCPSHPEVIGFASRLISRLGEVCRSSFVYVGGDEIKLPEDSRPSRLCPRCGESPSMDMVVTYWNQLAERAGDHLRLMIAGDMFLPKERFPPPLSANNTDGRSPEYIEALDRRIAFLNWHYAAVDAEETVHYLRQYGHEAFLAAGQYHLQNPFLHVQTTRKLELPMQIQTTWASPWPDDIPLEGVMAGALAHGGATWSDELRKACTELAEASYHVLPKRVPPDR